LVFLWVKIKEKVEEVKEKTAKRSREIILLNILSDFWIITGTG